MCGLAGYVGLGDEAYLRQACRLLAHRGPDASGTWHGDTAGLAHTRLAILDLSEAGAQPMSSQGVHIAYNGEIYNSPELRDELEKQGCSFRGHSDTETLLQGYRIWGDAVVERLSGMFAFAIWDEGQQRMFLARDRFGIKPLFYALHASGIVFASEIKAILAHPAVKREVNPPMVDAYLALGYVPGPETIFAGVKALPPAHCMCWQNGKIEIKRYWTPPSAPENANGDEAELVEELDKRLNAVVREHLLADVEVGAFLSGGVDSSLVCAIAQQHAQRPVKAFTIGFSGGGDERRYARMVAEHIGAQHVERLAEVDLVERLPGLMRHLEQPLFDNSVLPTYFVSQVASEHVKVVLSGDGGDEPFFGYEWTRWALALPRLLPAISPRGWLWAYENGNIGKAKRLLYDLSHDAEARYLRRISTDRVYRQWLYTADYLEMVAGTEPLSGIKDELASMSGPNRFAMADLRHYLPEDVLFKVDRMSMAHGLEVRVPLLDHQLLEFVLQLPVCMRFRHGHGKYLLRKVARRYLPGEILKPRKQGFTIPIGNWLRGQLADVAQKIFSSPEFASRGIIRPDRARKLLTMHQSGCFELGHRIWSLMVLEQWFRVWMDGSGEGWDE